MADRARSTVVLNAVLDALAAQGYPKVSTTDPSRLRAYAVQGSIDVVALAEAVESALGGDTSDDDEAKSPAELNAANDG